MRRLASLMLLAALITTALRAEAQPAGSYPSQPIRMVVPFAPGGVTDVMARILANRLSEKWTVVVENRPGAGGTTGSLAVARAAPDGYTILSNGAGMSITAIIEPNMPFDVFKELKPVSLVAVGAAVLVVHPSVPARTVQEFVTWLKANPGKVSYGSPGRGTTAHLYSEILNRNIGADAVHVPYRGTGPMLTDLIGGRIQFAIDNVAAPLEHIKAGTVIALGVTGDERWPELPDIPPIKETVKGFEAGATWNGIFLPQGVPDDIAESVARQVQEAVKSPAVSDRIREFSLKPVGNSPAEFAAFFKRDAELWRSAVKAAGLTPQQ